MLLKLSSTQYLNKNHNIVSSYKGKNIIIDDDIFLNKRKYSFISRKDDKDIINTVLDSISFLNQTYGHNTKNILPIQILDVIPNTKKIKNDKSIKVEDPGAVYDRSKSIDGSDAIIQLSTDFLTQQNEWSNYQFSIYLRKQLGLKNFTKLVTFHEAGHHMDYLNRNDLLQAINPKSEIYEKVQLKNFVQEDLVVNNLKNSIYEPIFKYFEGRNDVDEHIKRNFKENMADCWSCILLRQTSNNLNIKQIEYQTNY